MKFMRLSTYIGIILLLFISACNSGENQLAIINSLSFPENQIQLDPELQKYLNSDSILHAQNPELQNANSKSKELNDLFRLAEKVKQTKSDSLWLVLRTTWGNYRDKGDLTNQNQMNTDSVSKAESEILAQKWAGLNKFLLQFSGEVRFGDAIEDILYKNKPPVLSEEFLKSIIYTHIDDQIFLNVFGSSELIHNHTTGGSIKIIQKTNYPESNEINLICECSDVRYLDLFIRIPSWAVNPTVQHGNVKYVAHPGEYCQISRKWYNGDGIEIKLMN